MIIKCDEEIKELIIKSSNLFNVNIITKLNETTDLFGIKFTTLSELDVTGTEENISLLCNYLSSKGYYMYTEK